MCRDLRDYIGTRILSALRQTWSREFKRREWVPSLTEYHANQTDMNTGNRRKESQHELQAVVNSITNCLAFQYKNKDLNTLADRRFQSSRVQALGSSFRVPAQESNPRVQTPNEPRTQSPSGTDWAPESERSRLYLSLRVLEVNLMFIFSADLRRKHKNLSNC